MLERIRLKSRKDGRLEGRNNAKSRSVGWKNCYTQWWYYIFCLLSISMLISCENQVFSICIGVDKTRFDVRKKSTNIETFSYDETEKMRQWRMLNYDFMKNCKQFLGKVYVNEIFDREEVKYYKIYWVVIIEAYLSTLVCSNWLNQLSLVEIDQFTICRENFKVGWI